jgi:hypothetical protein
MRSRTEKTEYLLREIGEIDDKLLAEASSYRPVRRQNFRYGLIAAVLAFAFVMVVIRPVVGIYSDLSGENEAADMNESGELFGALDAVLSAETNYITNSFALNRLSHTGAPRLVWENKESGEVSVCYLSVEELSRIRDNMGKGKAVEENAAELTCNVWVVDEYGRVTTPYLKASAGNEGCDLFAYEPEIIPTEDLIQCISDILS